MQLSELISQIQQSPERVQFSDVISVIENHYIYTPTAFSNGSAVNQAGTNEGSCKIFAFALLNQFTEQQTLSCFGDYYRVDVLAHPNNSDHANIRNFINTGWDAIKFESEALRVK